MRRLWLRCKKIHVTIYHVIVGIGRLEDVRPDVNSLSELERILYLVGNLTEFSTEMMGFDLILLQILLLRWCFFLAF